MNENRPRPRLALLANILLALTPFYLLSFGPACWLCGRGIGDSRILSVVY